MDQSKICGERERIKMNKLESLDKVKELWNDEALRLDEKIETISEIFYSIGLDVEGTGSYIGMTAIELGSFLRLSEYDEDVLRLLGTVNPPRTTWHMLSNASNEEAIYALKALMQKEYSDKRTASEFVYEKMQEVSGPSIEQKVGDLTEKELFALWEKSKSYPSILEKTRKFWDLWLVKGERDTYQQSKSMYW